MPAFIPILGAQTRPDGSGNIYQREAPAVMLNDAFNHLLWAFENTGIVRIKLNGLFRVPEQYLTSPKLVVLWTATSSGNAVFDFDYRSIAPGETFDPVSVQESVSVTDAAPTARFLKKAEITLNSANFAAGDTVPFEFSRDLSNASDTISTTIYVSGLYFQYN